MTLHVNFIDGEIRDLTARIEELRAERGRATLAGEAFDSSELYRLTERLDALRDVREDARQASEAEVAERHRAAREERRRELRKAAAEAERRRLDATARAEDACRELGASLAEAFDQSDALDEALRALHGLENAIVATRPFEAPRSIYPLNREVAAGARIALLLSQALRLTRLGALNLEMAHPPRAEQDPRPWADQEREAMQRAVAGLGVTLEPG